MAAFTVIASIAFYIVFIIGLVIRVNKRNKDLHRQTQYKLSDAELFKMMTAANHFISSQQLASSTSLTLKEASAKLQYLSMQKVIRKFNNSKDQPGLIHRTLFVRWNQSIGDRHDSPESGTPSQDGVFFQRRLLRLLLLEA